MDNGRVLLMCIGCVFVIVFRYWLFVCVFLIDLCCVIFCGVFGVNVNVFNLFGENRL